MKKIIYLMLAAILMCVVSACGKEGAKGNKVEDDTPVMKELTDPRGVTLEDTSDGMAVPKLVETLYETRDVVIADYIPTEMGYAVDPSGTSDSTAGIQKALYDCYNAGGGTVYLPAGNYAISNSIYIPPFVTLRGDWQDPDVGTEYGTIISVWMEGKDRTNTGIFRLGGSSGAVGLTVYYPLQSLDMVMPYPYTFYISGTGADHSSFTISDITIINGYRGVGTAYYDSHDCLHVNNVKGTYLLNGYHAGYSADVGTLTNFKIDNKYWKEAAADCMNSVSAKALDAYTKKYVTGIELADLDWTQLSNISISGCATGIRGVAGSRSTKSIAYSGCMMDLNITDCVQGIVFDDLDIHWGTVIARSYVEGGISNNTSALMKLTDVEVKGDVMQLEEKTIIEDDSDLSAYAIDYTDSYVKPGSNIIVTNLPNGILTDAGPTLQEALNAMSEEGGGVVYVPAGVYRFRTPVSVPAGVELRGCSSVANRDIYQASAGTLFLCYYGDDASNGVDDEAFITLAGENAGLNGIRIVYPENGVRDTDLNTTYTVRGKAPGVYVVNCMISASAYGVDFRGCDNHYIQSVYTCCYYNTFRLGGENGTLTKCLQNATVLVRTATPGLVNWITEGKMFEELFEPVLKKQCQYIIIDQAKNQHVYNTFAYGVNKFLVNSGSENSCVSNVGTDGMPVAGLQLTIESGSMAGINIMRLGGISYEHVAGKLNLYNRIAYNQIGEKTLTKE